MSKFEQLPIATEILTIIFLSQVRDLERVHSRDKHNQQSKKKAGDAALKVQYFDN